MDRVDVRGRGGPRAAAPARAGVVARNPSPPGDDDDLLDVSTK